MHEDASPRGPAGRGAGARAVIRRACRAVAVIGLSACAPLQASEPLWEIGAGLGAATFPEYRGSKERSGFVVPLPYFAYRGDRLRVDREGARGLLWSGPRYELDLSIDGAVPVDSSEDGPRAGMAELDPLIEFGPSLNWTLGHTGLGRWRLDLPLRAAVATDLDSTAQEGWTFNPALRLFTTLHGWDARFSAGPRFGSRDFHAYYYDVEAADVRPGRPAFRADAGYSGLALRASAARRFGRFWLGAFVRYDHLAGTAFEDSPLVETDHALSAGLGLSWVFRQSDRRVPQRLAETGPGARENPP